MTREELRIVIRELVDLLSTGVGLIQSRNPELPEMDDIGMVLIVTDDATGFLDIAFDADRADGSKPLSAKVGEAVLKMLDERKRILNSLQEGGAL